MPRVTKQVYHQYDINVSRKSAWGVIKEIEAALEPLKSLHEYGFDYNRAEDRVRIWWKTDEPV